MTAYKINPTPEQRLGAVDLGYRYHLPQVECSLCTGQWKHWGNGDFEYPAFKFGLLNDREFNFCRVVTVAEFEKICARIIRAAGRPVMLIPGASIGELAGTSSATKLPDFVWGRVTVPQISRRARDLLASESIHLLTAEASIRCRGKHLDSHLAIQVESVPLLTEESLRRFTITHCPNCGNYKQVELKPKVPEGYMIKRAAWPVGQHLVKLVEHSRVIASDEFIAAVKKHNLTGILFEECGQFV